MGDKSLWAIVVFHIVLFEFFSSPKFIFFWNLVSKIDVKVVFLFIFFNSYSSISDFIFQKVNSFEKRFLITQIFRNAEFENALDNIFRSDFGKRFPKFCYM
jgi:hypothetical protein